MLKNPTQFCCSSNDLECQLTFGISILNSLQHFSVVYFIFILSTSPLDDKDLNLLLAKAKIFVVPFLCCCCCWAVVILLNFWEYAQSTREQLCVRTWPKSRLQLKKNYLTVCKQSDRWFFVFSITRVIIGIFCSIQDLLHCIIFL